MRTCKSLLELCLKVCLPSQHIGPLAFGQTTVGWNSCRQFATGKAGIAKILLPERGRTSVNGYFSKGFAINNVKVPGSVLCYKDIYLLWRPRKTHEITPESLILAELIKPTPEMLVFGTGQQRKPLAQGVEQYLRQLGIPYEVLDTKNAVGLFNVMVDEGRHVLAAMLCLDEESPLPENLPKLRNPIDGRGEKIFNVGYWE